MPARAILSSPKAKGKIAATMKEFSKGSLRSGSKTGKKVTSKRQALAISLSQARKAVK